MPEWVPIKLVVLKENVSNRLFHSANNCMLIWWDRQYRWEDNTWWEDPFFYLSVFGVLTYTSLHASLSKYRFESVKTLVT